MPKHGAEIIKPSAETRIQIAERFGHAVCQISVKPPISVGPESANTILGTDADATVSINEIVSFPDESSSFLARSGRGDAAEAWNEDLRHIAERIVRVADDPSQALEMMYEIPFPEIEPPKPTATWQGIEPH